jgi:hypothetical protein
MDIIDYKTHVQIMGIMTQHIETLNATIDEERHRCKNRDDTIQNLQWTKKALEEENEVLKVKIKKLEEGKK